MHIHRAPTALTILAAATLSGCGDAPAEKPKVMAPIAVAAASSEKWTPCAQDGGTCTFEGLRKVRFGDGKSWFHRTAQGSIRCDATMFGDPAPNARKTCDMRE